MAVSKVSDLNSLYANIFEAALFVAQEGNIMLPTVRVFSATGYMARKFGEYNKATVGIKPEGEDFVNAPAFDKDLLATFTPQARMAVYILTDERVQTDPDDAMTDAARALGMGLAEQIDIDLAAAMADFTTDKGPGAGTAITLGYVSAAIAVLRARKVRPPYTVMLHDYHWHKLWTELGKPAANQAFLGDVANEALRQYAVGQFVGADWITNPNIAIDANSDAISGVYSREALGYDEREAPYLETERDASRKATELVMAVGYAAGVIRADYGIKLTADATEPTN